MKIVLYKWPPSPGIDAANPRGVSINRILSYLGVEYTARIVNPTTAGLDPKKIGNWISGFPLVSLDGERVNGIYRILKALGQHLGHGVAQELWATNTKSAELASWAFDHFYFLAIYARFNKPDNFLRYTETNEKTHGDPEIARTINVMRDLFLESLKWSSVGGLSEIEFLEVLNSGLSALEERLAKGGPQILGDHISVADFAVFGPLQALLTPEMEERDLIKAKYPKLLEWARIIDSRSTGRWTRSLINL